MRDIEEMLKKEKTLVDSIETPEKFETRIREALGGCSFQKPKRKLWRGSVIAVCIAAMFVIYNFDTLAYCGKTLLGYDNVMNGTLKELNELGKGQHIGKSFTFENGIKISLDGIMIDDNQFLAFYTVMSPSGNVDDIGSLTFDIKGFIKRYHQQSGQGEMSADGTEIKWIQSFERPSVFEKNLDFNIYMSENGKMELGKIDFRVDIDKAMGKTLKQDINCKVESADTKLEFDNISASPTETIVYGTMANTLELAKDQLLGERFRPNSIKVKLLANGMEVDHQGGGTTTDAKGIRFECRYDALPEDLDTLQLLVESFSVDRDSDVKTVIEYGDMDKEVNILGQTVAIRNVYEKDGNTYVTIASEDDMVLTRVSLIVDGEKIGLKETNDSDLEKLDDGKIIHKRTLVFPASGGKCQLFVERITYTEKYDQVINISI